QMWKIFDLSESPTVDFQITGRGKVTTETHSFLCMYDNFNKLLAEVSIQLIVRQMRGKNEGKQINWARCHGSYVAGGVFEHYSSLTDKVHR
ncbi:MAG: hypothetical protein WB870_04470, partial [Gallionellaceae bacterium]